MNSIKVPTGFQLQMNPEEMRTIANSLEGTADLCESLIRPRVGRQDSPNGSLLYQLPGSVIKALRDAAVEHRRLAADIRAQQTLYDSRKQGGGE